MTEPQKPDLDELIERFERLEIRFDKALREIAILQTAVVTLFEEETDENQDNKARANCEKAGQPGHRMCGICPDHNLPRLVCGCFPRNIREKD